VCRPPEQLVLRGQGRCVRAPRTVCMCREGRGGVCGPPEQLVPRGQGRCVRAPGTACAGRAGEVGWGCRAPKSMKPRPPRLCFTSLPQDSQLAPMWQPSLRGEPAWRLVVLSSKGGTRFILLPRSAGTDMADLSVSPTLRFCPPFVPWPASSLPPLPSPNPPGSVLTALNPAPLRRCHKTGNWAQCGMTSQERPINRACAVPQAFGVQPSALKRQA
jgi:hypothetical protein